MKHIPVIGAAAAVIVAVMLFAGALSAQGIGPATQSGPDSAALAPPEANTQDLQACEQDCRSRFGYDVYASPQWRRGGSRDGAYYAYARCIAECNRKFWKDFDKEMDELERE